MSRNLHTRQLPVTGVRGPHPRGLGSHEAVVEYSFASRLHALEFELDAFGVALHPRSLPLVLPVLTPQHGQAVDGRDDSLAGPADAQLELRRVSDPSPLGKGMSLSAVESVERSPASG